MHTEYPKPNAWVFEDAAWGAHVSSVSQNLT